MAFLVLTPETSVAHPRPSPKAANPEENFTRASRCFLQLTPIIRPSCEEVPTSTTTSRVEALTSNDTSTIAEAVKAPSTRPQSTVSSLKAPSLYPEYEDIKKSHDDFFLKEWEFPTKEAKSRYIALDLTKWTCYVFSDAKYNSDRVFMASGLLILESLVFGMCLIPSPVKGDSLSQTTSNSWIPQTEVFHYSAG